MNLIPKTGPATGNYFCTWDSQCDEINTRVPKTPDFSSRDAMCGEFLFGENGLLNSFDGVRGDLIVVLDDGWDVPYGATDRRLFGSLEADPERFPSLRFLSPPDRLKALSEKVLALGYRGLGLWVPTQTPSLVGGREVALTPEEERLYWEERAKWCRDAGIVYIKADWGAHQGDAAYCEMMSDCFRKYSPDTLVEHGLVGRSLFEDPERGCAVSEETRDYLRRVLPFSDYLRTYDVVHELKYSSTIDRAAVCLESAEKIAGQCAVLNIEDTALIGAALGCSVGVMRHDLERKRKYLPLPPRPVPESVCALRWQRLAPPFAANKGSLHISGERLRDVWRCKDRPSYCWPGVPDGDYYMTAPAAISRDMPLPEVEAAGEKPYVVCSVHPENGALCVAVTPRTLYDRIDITPPAKIRLKGGSPEAPAGIFGSFESLSIEFHSQVEGRRICAQSLLNDEARDVTDAVILSDNVITVPGSLMSAVTKTDGAIPAIVIRAVQP